MSCRTRSVHVVQGVLGSVTCMEYLRVAGVPVLAGGFACDLRPMTWKFWSFAAAKSMTKQPLWSTVSSQVTLTDAPGVRFVLGCDALRATPHGPAGSLYP